MVPSVQSTQTGTENGTNNYSLILVPAGVLTGNATISIVATDSNGLKATASFNLFVVIGDDLLVNSQSISIPPGSSTSAELEQGEAAPYPSVIKVAGWGGAVQSVQVSLVGLTHVHPEDLDVLLVSPDSTRAVMLMAHAGGPVASGLRLTFAEGASPIPSSGTLASQTYGPANYSSRVSLPLPAPTGPYSANLAVFKGLSPNGDWKLYVLDDTYPTGGTIDSGWLLRIQTVPKPTLLLSLNGSLLRVTVMGGANSLYGLQSTLDLSTWSDTGSVTTGPDGLGEFEFQVDAAASARFYRVLVK
jgi:subtilisin-like proprotein convertase family protein